MNSSRDRETVAQQLTLDGISSGSEWHLPLQQLEAGLELIRQSPVDEGCVELIVCRPASGTRKVLPRCELSLELGLVGDNWKQRGYRKSPDGRAHPDMQLNLMNARAIALIARTPARWPMAGDQFYVNLDLGPANLPPGTRLAIGSAVIQITAEPHRGCVKFAERFGQDAVRFVNSDAGKALNLRGINAKVIQPGQVATGDVIRKLPFAN
ncbi:MAG TPA: hypothetical protein VM553_02585 [Dongiaceae bacterium]|nr:hypothetical protein [Dongiaceae bacterium]